jgi:rubredoxin
MSAQTYTDTCTCPLCSNEISTHCHGIYNHINKSHKTDEYPEEHSCPHCDIVLSTQHMFVYHIKDQHPDSLAPAYECPMCDTSFERRGALFNHIDVEHLNKEPKFDCPYCDW